MYKLKLKKIDSEHLCQHSSKCNVCLAIKNSLNHSDINYFINAHEEVIKSKKFNFEGCRIPVNTRMNMEFIRSWLQDYEDYRVCDFLEFGFPIGAKDISSLLSDINKKDLWKFKNHKGANDFPEEINRYFQKEIASNAIIGPFKSNPFSSGIKISPLNSVAKKDTSERRIILDLSFPKGRSINDHISKTEYLDRKMDLIFPKVDDFVQLIKTKGRGCLLFKVDLRKAYRQVPICPSSYNLVAYMWKKHIFFDTVLSMGSRSSSFCCQSVTNAIVFMLFKIGILVLNYLDDLASAEKRELADFSFLTLRTMLQKCGIEESVNKACAPSTIMPFLGILFNTELMTLEIIPERLKEIKSLLIFWLDKDSASLKEVQSLIGKLNFIAACVRPGRIFISRLLQWLKILYNSENKSHCIPSYVKKDIQWWNRFLPLYNGVSMMMTEEFSQPDEIFSSDSCLTACGGYWKGNFFHSKFPNTILDQNYHINILEMMSVILCLRLWGSFYKGKRIKIFCDNLPVCYVINSGRAKCTILQSCLRELAFLTAIYECEVRAVHLDTTSNRLADHLSRWYIDECHEKQFYLLTTGVKLTEYEIHESLFDFINNW